MSGNRANSAAIQRRTNVGAPVQQQSRQPIQAPQRGNGAQQPQRSVNTQQSKNNSHIIQEPIQTPKLSVSDAMALVTLRLGRVETFINSMPTLEQLHNTTISNNDEDQNNKENENVRFVDENVFTNIVSRLDNLEKENTNKPPSLPKVTNTNELSNINNNIKELNKKYDTLSEELFQLKNLLLSVQSFAMQTNQKVNDIITENNNEKKKLKSLPVQDPSSIEVIENSTLNTCIEDNDSEMPETSV